MPTINALMPEVMAAMTDKSRPTYQSGLRRLAAELGSRELGDVRVNELRRMRDEVQKSSGLRRVASARDRGRPLPAYDPDAYGRGAAENFVRATRFLFRYACDAGLLHQSPAADLTAPRRAPSQRRPLTEQELEEIYTVAVTTGRDPALDGLLLHFLRHTAARQEGALNLCLDHLDLQHCRVLLTEKNGQTRTLPCARLLLQGLEEHARSRGARGAGDPVLRCRNQRPITRRHFNALFDRIDRHLVWTNVLDVSAHWLRHTTLADIAAVSDIRVAAAFAGHASGSLGVTGRYTQVTFEDLVSAYESVFGPRD